MEEAFLHFIWKFQQFKDRVLSTDTGIEINVLHPGTRNSDAGPDFKNAKIKIGEIKWNGSVEIHVHARDWYRHNHQNDAAYDNVILHVVWDNDAFARRKDNTTIPTLELKNNVEERLILNYKKLMEPAADILCKKIIHGIKPITILSMVDKVLAQRLEDRSQAIFREIALTNNDWEEIAWRMLCKNFGFKTNAFPFVELGKSLPINILKKEAHSLKTIEALLFGQAGFLEDDLEDTYYQELKKEYNFKGKKYNLEKRLNRHQWKFLRLRPANFPTIRIAQLSALIASQANLFSLFTNFLSIKDIKNSLGVTQSEYWINHYNFGVKTENKTKKLGAFSIDNILINTAAPLLFAYGIHRDQEELKEKAMKLLASVKPELNSIIKKWRALGMEISSAFDSQGLIQLYNQYCLKKRCLSCSIGVEIIKSV